jgi:TET-Associated Glycosyltransferase
MNPIYPVYIVSKGRWQPRLTSKALDRMGVPYRVVIEPQERQQYLESGLAPDQLLILPFANLGLGSISARNWIWEHAVAAGAARYWILDDNIRNFARYNRNLKILVGSGTIFRVAEEFVDRYTNVALAGFQYWMFIPRKRNRPPFTLNTRIYSCILIQTELPFRWRGRYNEDTDLSLRVLKDGRCTVLFNAFLATKQPTMSMKGGNTDELYQGDGRLKMAESLQAQHPDVTTISWKWGRWQHVVDYRPFRYNRLQLRPDVQIAPGVNDFGMRLTVRDLDHAGT